MYTATFRELKDPTVKDILSVLELYIAFYIVYFNGIPRTTGEI